MTMLRTAEIDMAETGAPSDIDTFLTNASWAIRSTYHTVLTASPGAAIFGRNMLFDIPYIADWNKIGEHRQHQTDRNAERENKKRVDYDYQVGSKVLIWKDCWETYTWHLGYGQADVLSRWNSHPSTR